MTTSKSYDVQSIKIQSSVAKVFRYIANPANLPLWTAAFRQADNQTALLVTPNGELKIKLKTISNPELGTIDWEMTMPDGSQATAFSRVVPDPDGNTIYSFVLLVPPGPIEKVEGTLLQQVELLKEELKKLKLNLERV
jgi:hypothetical protein